MCVLSVLAFHAAQYCLLRWNSRRPEAENFRLLRLSSLNTSQQIRSSENRICSRNPALNFQRTLNRVKRTAEDHVRSWPKSQTFYTVLLGFVLLASLDQERWHRKLRKGTL